MGEIKGVCLQPRYCRQNFEADGCRNQVGDYVAVRTHLLSFIIITVIFTVILTKHT